MAESSIEWTDATWNPVAGCTVISPGCTNCYAMRMAARLAAMPVAKYRGLTRRSGTRAVWVGNIRLDERSLGIPYRWSKPRRIFVNSMSDVFHERVPEDFIIRIWKVMADTPRHTYQVLTKRADRMATLSQTLPILQNVWLGVSVESSDYLSRISDLKRARASVKFVSFEPLLGSVGSVNLDGIQWAIVGGESGPSARPMEASWVDEIEVACRLHSVAFFFKQWGGKNKKAAGRQYRGAYYDEMPDLRI